MRILLSLLKPSIDSNLAQRVQIEIIAENLQRKFKRCAEGLNCSVDAYHPLIAAVLNEQ